VTTLTATVPSTGDAPHVRLTLSSALTGVTVWRVLDGSRTKVRATSLAGVVDDYECPQETAVFYEAGIDGEGTITSALVELPDSGDWLVHLTSPELSCQVTLREHGDWSSPSTSEVVDIIGLAEAVAVNFGPRGSDRGAFTTNTYTRDEADALKALLADGSVVYASTPAERDDLRGYLQLGDAGWARRINWSGDAGRIITLPYTKVKRPETLPMSGRPWSQLTAAFSAQSTAFSDGLR
jgi:hypothetical protein